MPAGIVDLLGQLSGMPAEQTVRWLAAAGRLGERPDVNVRAAARMVKPYAWLIRQAERGLSLTAAGRLSRRDADVAIEQLRLDGAWKGGRDEQIAAVHQLRWSAQRTGLVGREGRKLVVTPRGRAVRADPLALWRHLASHVPMPSGFESADHTALLLLLAMAAEVTRDIGAVVAEVLAALGWVVTQPIPEIAAETYLVLRLLGCFEGAVERGTVGRPTPEGIAFARAALATA